MKKRFQLIPEVHAVLVRDKQILLLRRYNTGFEDGNYSFPAGHLEGNETLRAAMVREAAEEVGVTILPEDLEVIHVQHRAKTDEERIAFYFRAESWKGEPYNAEPNKCDDVRWFAIDELPSNLTPYVRDAFKNYLTKILYSEFGWE